MNPACKIADEPVLPTMVQTSPVLVSYANHMLKDLRIGRYPACNFYWYGDGLFQEMLRLADLQMQALDAEAKAKGLSPSYMEPAYAEPKDYFSMTERDTNIPEENAA